MADGSLPKRCQTCQWFSPVGMSSGICREPRMLDHCTMLTPGGTEIAHLSPIRISPRYICDFWSKPKPSNLREAS